MTCLQILFLFSLGTFVSIAVYMLLVSGQRQVPFPPVVDPWLEKKKGRRITDSNQVDAIYRGAKKP